MHPPTSKLHESDLIPGLGGWDYEMLAAMVSSLAADAKSRMIALHLLTALARRRADPDEIRADLAVIMAVAIDPHFPGGSSMT